VNKCFEKRPSCLRGGRFLFLLWGACLGLIGCRYDPADVFEVASRSVVVIWTTDREGEDLGQGSGVVLADSTVVTNCHVVEEATRIRVSQGRDTVDAVVMARDEERDLCLLKLSRTMGKPARLGASKGLRIGQRVYTVGAPAGMELTIGEGILSGFRDFDSSSYLQTTAPISPGSSGGGLWDDQGRLLGITSFYEEDAQSLNFAAPVEWIAQIRGRAQKDAQDLRASRWFSLYPQLIARHDWGGLRDLARRWTAHEPESAWAWYARGVAARYLREPLDTTVQAFRSAINLDDAFGEAWEQLALVWGEHDSASLELEFHRRASLYLPMSSAVWFNLGSAASNMGDFTEAEEAFRRAISLDSTNAKSWSRWGLALFRMGRHAQADAALARALRLDSNDAEVHRARALVFQGMRRSDSVVGAWRKTLERDPEEWIAWHNLAVAQYKAGRWQQAALAFEEAVPLDPTDEEGWYTLSQAQEEMGEAQKAMQTLRKAVNAGGASARLWERYGESALRSEESQVAWDACSKSIAMSPQLSKGWACRSEAAFRLGRYQQAQRDGLEAVKLAPSDQGAWFTLAMVARHSGDAALLRSALAKLTPAMRMRFAGASAMLSRRTLAE
jgi:tetratricopeptide (TPR) repeat protein